MTAKEVRFGDDARQLMVRGVNILADAVRMTLGPRGRNAMLDRVIANVRGMHLSVGDKAIPVLEEMLREYRKQAR